MTVYVYRNLKHGRQARPLYSVMHRGRVIARRRRVLLSGVTFVVRPAGRRRVLELGRKNVHAFAKGTLCDSRGCFGIDANGKDLPVKITYHPHRAGTFLAGDTPVRAAGGVLLNQRGMSACYIEEDR